MGKELVIRDPTTIEAIERLSAVLGESAEATVRRLVQREAPMAKAFAAMRRSWEASDVHTREELKASIEARAKALKQRYPLATSDHTDLFDDQGLPR